MLHGFKQGELLTISVGRKTGKSQFTQYMANWDKMFKVKPEFEIITSAVVDGQPWHTVKCTKEIAAWVRTMNKCQWQEHIDTRGYVFSNIFDMDEKLYTMLGMKFS